MKIPFFRPRGVEQSRVASPEHSQLPPSAPRLQPRIGVNDKPSFDHPVSQFVSAEQIFSLRFDGWRRVFGWPAGLNRKVWESLYIINALDHYVGLRSGTRALGFGVGRERLVTLLAGLGCEVVATDYFEKREQWPTMAKKVEDFLDPKVCSEASFRSRVAFRNVDMNHIPPDLRDFDCLWSHSALEHIGGLQNGLDFIEAAMDCLRPGGIAVHTTEFNLVSNEMTYETPHMSFYRRHDIEALAERLLAKGHQIVLNFTRGDTPGDLHINPNPTQNWGFSINWQAGIYVITSIGLIVQKRLDAASSATPVNAELEIVIGPTSLKLLPSFTELRRPDGAICYDAIQHGGAAGDTIFSGPYTMLPSGSYRVAISGEIVGTFVILLTSESGRTVLHQQVVSSADDFVTFATITPVVQFEVVLRRTDTSERLLVERIILTRM
jgi:Methyltransferase domain